MNFMQPKEIHKTHSQAFSRFSVKVPGHLSAPLQAKAAQVARLPDTILSDLIEENLPGLLAAPTQDLIPQKPRYAVALYKDAWITQGQVASFHVLLSLRWKKGTKQNPLYCVTFREVAEAAGLDDIRKIRLDMLALHNKGLISMMACCRVTPENQSKPATLYAVVVNAKDRDLVKL